MALVPLNVQGSHWILAAIRLAQKRIQIYDSLGRRYPNVLVKLKKYLRMEYRNKKQIAMPAPHEWELDESTAATPRQTNGKLGIVCLLPWQLLLKQSTHSLSSCFRVRLRCLCVHVCIRFVHGKRS